MKSGEINMDRVQAESDSSESSEDDNWDDGEPLESEEIQCLFCQSVFNNVENALVHCKNLHNFDFHALKIKFQMDCYSFIKFINYVRKNSISPSQIVEIKDLVWNDDIYLKPILEFDPWLMFDFEEYFDSMPNDKCDTNCSGVQSIPDNLKVLQKELQEKNEQLLQLSEQLAQMKSFIHKILQDDDKTTEGNSENIRSNDNGYFESYSHHGIHYDMLSDDIRTRAYRNAILSNKSEFDDKTVLDLGCGTGILSLFAASAGAKKVFAIDNSDIISYTVEIIRDNQMLDKIEVIKAKIENETLTCDRVDIIISEWMGYFLLFEGMLDSLIYARDHYLKPNGLILPNKCNLYICGANDEDGYKKYVEFWNDVYGYSMKCIQKEVLKEAIIDVIPAHKIVTSSSILAAFDLYTCSIRDTSFSSSFELICNEDTVVNTFVGYFDTIFDLPNSNSFSTSALNPSTHWKQTIFYISSPIYLKKGQSLNGVLTCKRSTKNNRSLLISIAVNEFKFHYELD